MSFLRDDPLKPKSRHASVLAPGFGPGVRRDVRPALVAAQRFMYARHSKSGYFPSNWRSAS